MNGKVLTEDDRLFIESLIERSGRIKRAIMRLYLGIDSRGLDRWQAYIARTRGHKRTLNQMSYWPLRSLERITAIYMGGSLTAAEQHTFGHIAGIEDYKLSRYHSALFGTISAIMYFTGGEFTLRLSTVSGKLDTPLSLTTVLLFSMGTLSVTTDAWRFIDSFTRRRAHMPIGFFSLTINSTTLLRHWFKRLSNLRG